VQRSSDCAEQRISAVVFAHGMAMPAWSTALLARRIAPPERCHRFAYRSMREGFDHNLARLCAFLRERPEPTLDLVGHSLGGLLLVAAASLGLPRQPGRTVCLGSPLAGSAVADRLARPSWGRYLLGKSIYEFAKVRPQREWRAASREIGIIAGGAAFGAGRLIVRFDEPNDGTVAVAETRWDDAADHIVLPVGHLGLLWSDAVARQARHFLAHGRFARAAETSS
jgi:pimeloyl-ACP methyl ester carboxylesterase